MKLRALVSAALCGSGLGGCHKTEAAPVPAASACAAGDDDACHRAAKAAIEELARLDPAGGNLEAARQAIARRNSVAASRCARGDCRLQYAYTVGDGTDSATRAWKVLCKDDPEGESAGVVQTRPASKKLDLEGDAGAFPHFNESCEVIAKLAKTANALRQHCLDGALGDCARWSQIVIVEDPTRAAFVVLPKEHQLRRFGKAHSPFDLFSKERWEAGRQRLEQLYSDLHQRGVLSGRNPKPGECLEGYGGCRPVSPEDVAKRRRLASVRVAKVASSVPSRLPEAEIRAAVARQLKPLLECHREALIWSPHLQGNVTIEGSVDGAGYLWNPREVGSSALYASVRACAVEASLDWQLPHAGPGAKVTVTLEFEPSGGG